MSQALERPKSERMAVTSLVGEFMRRAGAASAEMAAAADLPWAVRSVARHKDIFLVGRRSTTLFLVLDGWAGRYSVRRNGGRRLTGFMLPGDLCGIHAVTGTQMDHSICALSDCVIAELPTVQVTRAVQSSATFGRALWHSKLVEEAMLRKWLLNSDNAEQSVAHLLCEFHARLSAIGQVTDDSFAMPLTQADVGDALGITPVHTNRMMKKLRLAGLAVCTNGHVAITDIKSLQRHCGFNPSYLHLGTD